MNNMAKKILFWLPRVLGIGFVLFLSVFALDVFGEYKGWDIVSALFMHLLPSIALLLVIIVSWRRDLIGAFVFLGAAAFYIYDIGFGEHWSLYAAIPAPAAIVGILFLTNWIISKRKKI